MEWSAYDTMTTPSSLKNISLMYIKNSTGPGIVPWGTSKLLLNTLLILTLKVPLKKVQCYSPNAIYTHLRECRGQGHQMPLISPKIRQRTVKIKSPNMFKKTIIFTYKLIKF